MRRKRKLVCPRCGLAVGLNDLECPACGADVGIWVRRGDHLYGPYTLAQVLEGVRQGRIVGSDELSVGNGPWSSVADVSLEPPPSPPSPRRVSSARTLKLAARILLAGAVAAGALAGYAWYSYDVLQVRARCAENLRAIYLAWRAYEISHGRQLQPAADWPQCLREFLPPKAEWWTCPRTTRPYVVVTGPSQVAGANSGPLIAEDPMAPGFRGRWLYVARDGTIGEAVNKPSWQGIPARGFEPAGKGTTKQSEQSPQ